MPGRGLEAEGPGYRVLEAEDRPRALRVLGEEGPGVDLLIADTMMPGGLTGVDLAHRARERLPGLKVVFTSGCAEPSLVRQGRAEGGVWLRKPYTALDLARTLRAVLDEDPGLRPRRRAQPRRTSAANR